VQALDLMRVPPGAGLRMRIAEFAWIVKNHARPLGCLRMGLPCQLMGTGMAFPWALIREARLASSDIVEDMRLGLDMAAAGAPPLFCPDAMVTSLFPTTAQGASDQRARWEGGHLSLIVALGPRLLARSIAERRLPLLAMVLDVCVPPLTVLALLLIVQVVVDAAFLAASGARPPLILAAAALAMVVLAVILAWVRFGRDSLTAGQLMGAPLYVLGKLPLYGRLFRRGKGQWQRAGRDDPHD
jgi:cellulose synthase/poly-beta-1,6-N-acetylglucosamine synthase-like glycosyltransferase